MAILCDMHSLMPVEFSHVVIYECPFTRMFFVVVVCLFSFAVVVIKCFMNWSECVMSVLGTTKHSLCNQCIDTWQ